MKNEDYNIPIVRNIYEYVYVKKVNCLIGVTGSSGSGKSVGAVCIGKRFSGKDFDLHKQVVYTVDELLSVTLESVSVAGEKLTIDKLRSLENVQKWLADNAKSIVIEPGKVVVFDEAGTGAYIREFFSIDNMTLSKIIQIWRFLRTVVFFVVPVDLRLMESTVIKFLNMEIKFLGYPEYDKVGKCVAYEYTGWNKQKREPYRQRVKGCMHGGYIRIHADKRTMAAYRKLSERHKVNMLAGIDKEHREKGKPKYTKKEAIISMLERGDKPIVIAKTLKVALSYVRNLKTELNG